MKRMRAVVAMLIVLLYAETGSNAATRLTENLAELLRFADAVVEVEVLAKTEVPPDAKGLPQTVYSLRVDRSYKGALAPGAEIKAACLGGRDGESQVIVPGQASFNLRDRAVLLLNRDRGRGNDGLWRITGGDAGQINLERNHLGGVYARRAAGQFEYYIPSHNSLSGYEAQNVRGLDKSTLDELLAALALTGRPVLRERSAAHVPTAASARIIVPASATPEPAEPVKFANGAGSARAVGAAIGRLLLALGLLSLVWLIARRRHAARWLSNSIGR